MANQAKNRGYEYIAICDHSKTLQAARGMDAKDYKEQMKEINKLNQGVGDISILSGAEINVDSDGNLDINNTVLKDLDFVIASIHSGFKQSREKVTNRLVSAMHNEYVHAIGHPTGRILNKRKPYDLDLTKIFETASELGILLELNSFPERLDLSDINCQEARKYDLQIVINTDSHNTEHMRYMELGVATARRGWLEKKQVFNTKRFKEVKKHLNL